MSMQGHYGFPCVRNPNHFTPDAESSSPAEIAAHKKACENWGKPEFEPNKGCFSEYNEKDELIRHVTRTSWGIGINMIPVCDGCNEMGIEDMMTCHECPGQPEFCTMCWEKHEKQHDDGII